MFKYTTKLAVENILMFFFLLVVTSLMLFARLPYIFFIFVLCLSALFTASVTAYGGFFAVIKTFIQKTE